MNIELAKALFGEIQNEHQAEAFIKLADAVTTPTTKTPTKESRRKESPGIGQVKTVGKKGSGVLMNLRNYGNLSQEQYEEANRMLEANPALTYREILDLLRPETIDRGPAPGFGFNVAE